MPIIKRTKLPVPPKPRPKSDDEFKLPGRPLEDLLKEARLRQSDAEWVEDYETASIAVEQAEDYERRIAAGELYEVDH